MLSDFFNQMQDFAEKNNEKEWNSSLISDLLNELGFKPWVSVSFICKGEVKELSPLEIWQHPEGVLAEFNEVGKIRFSLFMDKLPIIPIKFGSGSLFNALIENKAVITEYIMPAHCLSFSCFSFVSMNKIIGLKESNIFDNLILWKDWEPSFLHEVESGLNFFKLMGKDKWFDFRNAIKQCSSSPFGLEKAINGYLRLYPQGPLPRYTKDIPIRINGMIRQALMKECPELFLKEDEQNEDRKSILKYLAVYLNGKSSVTWQEVESFCSQNALDTHPLLLCFRVATQNINYIKNSESESYINNVLHSEIKKMCHELSEVRLKELWKRNNWGKTVFLHSLFAKEHDIKELSFLFKEIQKNSKLNFLNHQLFHLNPIFKNEEEGFKFLKGTPSVFREKEFSIELDCFFNDFFKLFIQETDGFRDSFNCIEQFLNNLEHNKAFLSSELLFNSLSKYCKEDKIINSFFNNDDLKSKRMNRF